MAVGVIGASKGIVIILFESLEAKNIEVTGISRNKKDIVASKRSKYFEMDVHQSLELKKVLEAHETVVHCSTFYSYQVFELSSEHRETNCRGINPTIQQIRGSKG